jgi:Na+-translocating ferredoxin:NAD+ oxidoreductase subunit G
MKYFLKLGFVLFLISAIAACSLALLNSKTAPIIKANKKQAENDARKAVLPSATMFAADSIKTENAVTENNPLKNAAKNESSSFKYYVGKNVENEIVGYTFVAAMYGYSSEVKTMVGLTPDFKVTNIKIIDQAETPGLGANCEKPEFTELFENMTSDKLKVDKDGGSIRSLTGATITTRAIANSIRAGVDVLMKQLPAETIEVVEE